MYRKLLAIAGGVMLACMLAGCGSSGANSQNSSKANNVTTYKAGTYKVGETLPAGEYLMTSSSNYGFWAVYSDTTKQKNIGSNDAFKGISYLTVESGTVVEVTGATFVSIADASVVEPASSFTADQYGQILKVGRDCLAGEYTFVSNGSKYGGFYSVRTSSRPDAEVGDGYVTAHSFENSDVLTLKDGQYISVKNCTAKMN